MIRLNVDVKVAVSRQFISWVMFGEKIKGKYHRYKKILSEDNVIEYINQLEECKKRTHSILNFSLFPKTGAMNTAKEWSEDRVDAFLYYLNILIKEINEIGVE